MKSTFFLFFAFAVPILANAQAPGIKPVKPDPSFFKIDLKESLRSGQFTLPQASGKNNIPGKVRSKIKLPAQGIYPLSVDGMPCLFMDPQKIDSRMVVRITEKIPYMPNPLYKNPVKKD